MRRRAIGGAAISLCVWMALLVVPVLAQPPLPHAFYGSVEINGEPAAVGTAVEARGQGVITDVPDKGNPITVEEAGKYGASDPLALKLTVQGDLDDGDPIAFYVNGVRAECYDPEAGEWVDTYPFESGGVTELNLRATVATATPGPSPTATETATPSPTPRPTSTPTPSPSPRPTSTPTPGPSPTPTSTPVPVSSPLPTLIPTSGPSPTPTSTPKPPTPSPSPTPGPSSTPTSTAKPPTPGSSPTATSMSKPTAPGASPTPATGPSTPSPTPTSFGQSGGGIAGLPTLACVAGVLALVGAAAVIFGVLGLRRRRERGEEQHNTPST